MHVTLDRAGFAALAARPYADVLVIGGGINGIATFRDLAMQGVDVALVERGDFAGGASAASSHMIHGGIRYLENGEFRLVHEAVTERNMLLRTAPHYVRPLQTTIPIFSTFSGVLSAPLRFLRHGTGRPHERGAVLIKIGLVIYDSFSRGGGRVPRHAFHGRRASLRMLPRLNPDVKYTATYWDASLRDPERLALDVLRDGVAAGRDATGTTLASTAASAAPDQVVGATATAAPSAAVDRAGRSARAANYTSAVGVDGGRVVLRDGDTGEEVRFAASVVVNATGPWTDLTNAALHEPTRYMGGTKGSHIVLDDPALLAATGGRELFFEHRDGRIVLIYPLRGRVLVGTTDIEHDMAEPIVCTEAEVDYFLDLIGHVLPDVPVDRDRIVYRYSGVRPLPGHGDLAPGFVSRDYRIEQTRLPGDAVLLSLVGGKWTTFRASAEHLADRALAALAVPRRRTTRSVPIGGGRGFPTTERARQQWTADHGTVVGVARAGELLARYGTVAADVIAAIAADPDDRMLAAAPGYSTGELRHLARTEAVQHLDDMLLRRTGLAFTGMAGPEAAREVAAAVAPVMGWDGAACETEVARALAAVHAADPVTAP
ncbi:glycerol-3-phosphate dehydrogenase/oxidase [Microbacterium luticocti]|uniref:glycerol-3-phosphate dehydrogenase/oxidase n=1 Tax=Microbacterium luticocti TaxID=451764 RepID=UPI0003F50BC6|nr:glycerol-3-phosphate dehydrogenase/oxidase [Microbacterium luticocti]